MSFFPAGFDPRADSLFALTLASVDTPDGLFRFLLGADGRFRDIHGNDWWGSVLITMPEVPIPIDGAAPAGEIGMTFFQDEALPDLVQQVRALGTDYIRGRALRFYVQPLAGEHEFHAPAIAPIPLARFRMRSIAAEAVGALQRRLTLSYEGVFAGRNEARRYFYTTADHGKLIGAANPSLQFMPDSETKEAPIW